MHPVVALGLGAFAFGALAAVSRRTYSVTIDTFEEDNAVPVVTHTFNGTSHDQAWGFVRAHMKYDSFFRDCTERGRFANFRCNSVVRQDGWR